MPGRIEKTVFISYRRTNFPWAYCIYQDLTHHGFDVFFDYQSIDSGSFEKVIIENIKARAHFIIILSPSAVEKFDQSGDWLRREIETAMDENRNIIPVLLEGFDFGSTSVRQALTGKLASLNGYNGMSLVAEYVEAGFEKLRNRFLNVALEDVRLHVLAEDTKAITETQQAAASGAPPIEKEELTAQKWFERGFVFAVETKNPEEAIRCFTEAILLEPNFADAYYNRGHALQDKGDLEKAIDDYSKAIRHNPNFADAFINRGAARRANNDLRGALKDYNEAIRLNPSVADAYFNRGNALKANADLQGALQDYDEAIRLEPAYAAAYYNRATIWERKRNYSSAISDYQQYLNLGGGARDNDQDVVEEKIKKLKSKPTRNKTVKKKRSGL